MRSNRNVLVLSVLLDGGLSYLLLTGIGRMLGQKSGEEQSYSIGYQDALQKVQKQIERRIALNPNDKDALRDLNNVREELSKAGARPENYQNRSGDEVKRFNSINTEEGRNPKKKSEDNEHRQRKI